jgi:hypothetical protein
MNVRPYEIEFLTPCFCGGAEQTRAELRPSAIRGQLRWWFRCLGGTPAEERTVFGGVQGDNTAASNFAVRVTRQPEGGQKDWHSDIPRQGLEPKVYLLGFFCGRTGRLNAPNGALAPGSRAVVEVVFKRPPTPRFEQTLRVFFSIGAIGFRATRAAGALTSTQHGLTAQTWNNLAAELRSAGFDLALLNTDFGQDWLRLLGFAGGLLKDKLRGRGGLGISAGRGGSNPNALGSAEPRQASVLHLRPVRIDGRLRLALVEAPHARILGQKARRAHGNRGPIVTLATQRRLIST